MKRVFFLFLFWFSSVQMLAAQDNLPPELSTEDIANFKIRIKEKVEALQNYIALIADKQVEMSKRDLAIKQALKLFLSTATMEVSFRAEDGQDKKLKRPMKDYFNRLKNLSFRSVKISSQDVCYISSILQAPDGTYKATATIYQFFEGCNGENNCYRDATKKEIDVTIEYKEDAFGEKRWVIMLGDVRVVETKKM